MKVLLLSALVFFPLASAAEAVSSIEFLSALDAKVSASEGDAVSLLSFSLRGTSEGFLSDYAFLQSKGAVAPGEFSADAKLSRGDISLMIARLKRLDGSLMYKITGKARYAYRACVADGIMPSGRSEYDVLSGQELIEAVSKSALESAK